jgi:23S rRNA (guanosine2251-2'-O)-methyltransferase
VSEVDQFCAALTGRAARIPQRIIALDGVTHSQNVGMIIRSALAAGMSGMLWPLRGSPWINGMIVKSSAGAIYRCPIIRAHTLPEGLYALKAAGFEIYGLAAHADETLFEFTPPHRSVYVVGSETAGISAEVGELVDRWLSIPISGPVESLNVAVAASLVCFHCRDRD